MEDELPISTVESLDLLMSFAESEGDISSYLESEVISKLGAEVCDSYERDKRSREDWEKVASKALEDTS